MCESSCQTDRLTLLLYLHFILYIHNAEGVGPYRPPMKVRVFPLCLIDVERERGVGGLRDRERHATCHMPHVQSGPRPKAQALHINKTEPIHRLQF